MAQDYDGMKDDLVTSENLEIVIKVISEKLLVGVTPEDAQAAIGYARRLEWLELEGKPGKYAPAQPSLAQTVAVLYARMAAYCDGYGDGVERTVHIEPAGEAQCDFNCGKMMVDMVRFRNTENRHQWVSHLECLRETLDIQEGMLNEKEES